MKYLVRALEEYIDVVAYLLDEATSPGAQRQGRRARPPSRFRSILGPGADNDGAVGGAARARRQEWTQRIVAAPARSNEGSSGGRPSRRAASARGTEPHGERWSAAAGALLVCLP